MSAQNYTLTLEWLTEEDAKTLYAWLSGNRREELLDTGPCYGPAYVRLPLVRDLVTVRIAPERKSLIEEVMPEVSTAVEIE